MIAVSAVVAVMEHAGFVFGSYAVVFATVGAFAWRVLRRGRRLAAQVDDAQKYWH
jgi:heme exporter protein CcmD